MMVARSYQYKGRQPEAVHDEKAKLRFQKTPLPTMPKESEKQALPRPTPASGFLHTFSNTAPSKPVVIPQPAHHGLSPAQSARTRGPRPGIRQARLPTDHSKDDLSPSVAALLAVTSIPPRARNARRRRSPPTADRRISIDELIQEWRRDDRELSSSGYGSPLDILLESLDDANDDACSEQDTDVMSMRSVSSESIPSMPSLEADERSLSSWSTPSTPSFSRKEKYISSPPKEDCILDHPLLHFHLEEACGAEDEPAMLVAESATAAAPTKPKSSFKSNLTASFQALKSAAKSFSNFTAPSIPPDDLLTRSILSPRFTSEMRPKQFQGVPTPAMRRYLNPQQRSQPPISPSELFHDTLMPQPGANLPSAASPMIQLQTYNDSRRSPSAGGSRKRRANDALVSEAGRASSPIGGATVRQREPRENGDFLRVIVMEMNMRRQGKLDSKATGKARIWLPPRKMEVVEVQVGGAVPARWASIAADDV